MVQPLVYYKARKSALNNGMQWHLAAILWRGKTPVYIGANSAKTHPAATRTYKDGCVKHHMHAEMNVLRFAKPGDMIEVLRWEAKPEHRLTMAAPCKWCMQQIRASGIYRVYHTNWDGQWEQIQL